MKININILLGALALGTLSVAGAAPAVSDTTYIAGSTAFESVADAALTNYTQTHGGGIVARDFGTLGKETNLLLNYTNAAGTCYIAVHWTGSEGGIQSIDAPTNNPALVTFMSTNTTGTTTSYVTNSAAANLAFSDTGTAASLFNGTPGADGRNYTPPLHDYQVAAQGFAFVTSTNFTTLTNMTTDGAKALYTQQGVAASVLTGVAADTNNTVFAVGRNADSGTRVSFLADMGLGTKATVFQYFVASTNEIYLAPVATNDGYVSPQVGNDGYGSTGSLLGAVTNALAVSTTLDQTATVYPTAGFSSTPTPGNTYLIGYVGAKSGLGDVGLGAVILPYNGVYPSTAAIQNGQYTYWNYEHIMVSKNNTNANYNTVATALKNYILTASLGSGNANLSNMLVQRLSDGGSLSASFVQP